MRVGLYARVSTERQKERGTIGSQLEALRAAAAADGNEVLEEFIDDGHSGARLDRPALDRLRDAAEAGVLDGVLCLRVDRLARAYPYQVLILEELERFGVTVRFLEGPSPSDDPQATLLIQMQGVIAEYEKAKVAERNRRGKVYRARAGEIPFWKVSYGYRRVVDPDRGRSRIEVFEPEAQVVREIFAAYVERGRSVRQVAFELRHRAIPSPTGKPQWGTSAIDRVLRNEAYVGTVYYNRHERIEGATRGRNTRLRERPREEWIAIPVPAIIDRDTFDRVSQVSHENFKMSPRGAAAEAWLLRGLIECGHCHVGCSCHNSYGRNRVLTRYYCCRNHDLLRAGSEDRLCPERNIRAKRARRVRARTGPPSVTHPRPAAGCRARGADRGAQRERTGGRAAGGAWTQPPKPRNASALACSTPTKPGYWDSKSSPLAPVYWQPAAPSSRERRTHSAGAAPSSPPRTVYAADSLDSATESPPHSTASTSQAAAG